MLLFDLAEVALLQLPSPEKVVFVSIVAVIMSFT